MKKLSITLCALIFVCAIGQAQSKNDLKGPKAKNYKVWADDSETVQVYTVANQETVKGPEAKNQKPWKAQTAAENKVAIKRDTKKSSLKGPSAKNYKPWQ